MPALLSLFGVEPRRIGGVEIFARALSHQLADFGWRSILCFLAEPPEPVRRFLELPNTELEIIESVEPGWHTLLRTAALLRKHRPEVLHLYFTGFLSPYPWLARVCSVRAIYFTDQGSHPEGYEPSPAAAWKRLAGRAITAPVSKAICISDYNLHCLTTRGFIAPSRVSRIYNAVDLGRPSGDGEIFRREYAIPRERDIVLQVSWIIPEKGIPDLLEAARIVLAANPRVQFVVAGEGAYRREYTERAAAFGIADHFTWTGLVQDPVASGLYSAASIVCQLSRWQEAFGWVIAEAMACARPIVATRVGGIPEIVDERRTGFLVSPRNPAEAAARILDLLAEPRLRQQMGALAREAVRARFNLERNVAELMKIYGIPQRVSRGVDAVMAH